MNNVTVETLEPRVQLSGYKLADLGNFANNTDPRLPADSIPQITDNGTVAYNLKSGRGRAAFVKTAKGKPLAVPPLKGDNSTTLRAVDDAGVAVGVSFVAPSKSSTKYQPGHALIYAKGKSTAMPAFKAGGTEIVPTGMNNLGIIVGYAETPTASAEGTLQHGFMYKKKVYTDFGTNFIPAAINDAGTVVGYVGVDKVPSIWTKHGPKTLTIGFNGTIGGINNNGDIAGYYDAPGGTQTYIGYLFAGGTTTTFGTTPTDAAGGSFAYNANDADVVVGGSDGNALIYTRKHGAKNLISFFTNPKFVLKSAFSINNSGQILAVGLPTGGTFDQLYLLTPA